MTKTFRQELRFSFLRRDFVSILSMYGSMTAGDMQRVNSLLNGDRSINCPLVLFADPAKPLVFASNQVAQAMLSLTGRFGTYVDYVECPDKADRDYWFKAQIIVKESLECLQRADSGLLIAAGHVADPDVLKQLVVRAVSKECNAVCILVCHRRDFEQLYRDRLNEPLLDRMIVCKQSEQ